MCGRIVRFSSKHVLADYQGYQADLVHDGVAGDLEPSWNTAPTMLTWILHTRVERPSLDAWAWGIRLRDGKLRSCGRLESTDKVWRPLMAKHRCVVPVNGFYEWLATDTGKQPYYFSRRDGLPLLLAGLSRYREDAETGKAEATFLVLTRPAGKVMAPVHDRMPALVDRGAVSAWINPELQDLDRARDLLTTPEATDKVLQAWPVSRRANFVRNNDASLITPIASPVLEKPNESRGVS